MPTRSVETPRWRKVVVRAAVAALALGVIFVLMKTHAEAHRLLTNPMSLRKLPAKSPTDYGLPFEDAGVTTADGLKLVGWYIPPVNGSLLLFVHGYKDSRESMLGSAALFHRHGYGVLLLSLRAHDRSDGELITFGHLEMQDLDAWYRFARWHPGVDPARIGLLGASMGGAVGIDYAARNPDIKAVAADSAFSSIDDTIATSVRHFTGLPPFPFASLIGFWAEREGGFSLAELNTKRAIRQISPRPVFLMQGGADEVISPDSGERLYEAAGRPKELWFDPALGHARFFAERRDDYERRVVGFFDKYLLGR